MKTIGLLLICAAIVAVPALSYRSLQAAEDVKTVAVVNSEIVLNPRSDSPRILTSDGGSKYSPILSKSGKLIAYLSDVPEGMGLGRLNVIDEFGRHRFTAIVAGVGSGYENSFRYIENFQWIDDNTIMVGGSFNPSGSRYFVFDLRTGNVTDIWDAQYALPVSPDGRFVGFLADAPHWRAQDDYSPSTFHIQEGFFGAVKDISVDVQFLLGPAVWSPDGRMIALVQQDRRTKRLSAILIPVKGEPHEVDLPQAEEGSATLYWRGSDLFIRIEHWSSKPDEFWSVSTKDWSVSRLTADRVPVFDE